MAGMEALPFGVLVLIGGMLLVLNTWTVVDARAGVDAAARDYLRAYTASASPADGHRSGERAATSTLEGHGRTTDSLTIDPPLERFGPCTLATVTVRVVIPAVRIPFVGIISETTISSTQSELVQPYSTMAPGVDTSLEGTPCES